MRIVFLDRATVSKTVSFDMINDFGPLEIYNNITQEEIKTELQDVEIIITNKIKMDRDLLSSLPKLRLICLTATGTNNVDLAAARDCGIAVCNVAGYSTESVAQHCFALLFYLLEHLPKYDSYVKSGAYAKNPVFTYLDFPFWELSGKNWGIIGLGTIGRRVADIATAFGCSVSYYSTSAVEREENYPRLSLQELLEQSDVLSIHAPLNERTEGLLTSRELAWMRPHAILLNLGRGAIVDEAALSHALKQNQLAAAGLDVLSHEPIEEHNPLLDPDIQDKIIITPHIAWGSTESFQRLIQEIHSNIAAFLAGKQRNRVEL